MVFNFSPEAIEKSSPIEHKPSLSTLLPIQRAIYAVIRERMEAVAAMSPWIVSDEIYHGLVYEGKEHSILEFTDRAFVLNGFSKLFAMTGLRLGYLIAPEIVYACHSKSTAKLFHFRQFNDSKSRNRGIERSLPQMWPE
jgi:DNA-binding transcriptional MocR family regulator